jgi:alcohol dehydrogenase (cytochrome c)
MNWYFQFTPGDMWDYDEVGTHILIDADIAGQPRKLITHSARNGFLYTMDRYNGQIIGAKPYTDVNWTKGIDQKTGKPVDYDPGRDIQTYAGVGNLAPNGPLKTVCPSIVGANNYWPSSYSPKTKLLYIPALTGCANVEIDRTKHNAQRGWNGGNVRPNEHLESNLTAVDPITFEIKKNVHLRFPNYSGTLSTGGGLVFLALFDGTVAAFDDTTLEELWKINVGSGFTAPPMTFEANGRQYVAIASGPSPVVVRLLREFNPPELRGMRQATVLYVFGL